MNLSTVKILTLLAIVLLFVVYDTTILRGERDYGDLVFESPAVAPERPTRQANYTTQSQTQSPTLPPNTKSSRIGKASITQTSATMPLKAPRTPFPGTSPKQTFAGNANVSVTNKPLTNGPPEIPPSNLPVIPPSPNENLNPSVTTAGHKDEMTVIGPDGNDISQKRRKRGPEQIPLMTSPTDRNTSTFKGSVLGLNRETATERLIQMQNDYAELDRENEELRRQNALLLSRVKETQEQLMAGVREIQLARKELSVARGDLDRLRNDLQTLREKVRNAEKEHATVLQSLGPILQQLLESDDVSGLPPNPSDRE